MPRPTQRQLQLREANRAYRARISSHANDEEVVTLSCSSPSSNTDTILGSTTKNGPALTIIDDDTNQTIFQRFHLRSVRSSSNINRHLAQGQALLDALFLAADGGNVQFGSSFLTFGFLRREGEDGEVSWGWSDDMEQLQPASIEFLVWVKELVNLAVEIHL